MYYSFKESPKQLAERKASQLFGMNATIKVLGGRLSPLECKNAGKPVDSYLVECFVNEKLVAQANSRDWRKAYKLLVLEVEKAYESTLMAPF